MRGDLGGRAAAVVCAVLAGCGGSAAVAPTVRTAHVEPAGPTEPSATPWEVGVSPFGGRNFSEELRVVGHDAEGTYALLGTIRVRMNPAGVASATQGGGEPLVRAVHGARGWIFVEAGGVVRRATGFLDALGPADPGPHVHAFANAGAGRIVVRNRDGTFATSDGSAPFTPLAAPEPGVRARSVIFQDADVGLLVGYDGRAWATSDGAAHWRSLSLGDEVALGTSIRGERPIVLSSADNLEIGADGTLVPFQASPVPPAREDDDDDEDDDGAARGSRAAAVTAVFAISPAVLHAQASRLSDGRYVYASETHVWFFHPDGTLASDGTLPGECDESGGRVWGDAFVARCADVSMLTRDGHTYTTLERGYNAYSTDGRHALAIGGCNRDRPEYRGRRLCARRADGTTQLVRLEQDAAAISDGAGTSFVVSTRSEGGPSLVLVDAETGAKRPIPITGLAPEIRNIEFDVLASGELMVWTRAAMGTGPLAGPIALHELDEAVVGVRRIAMLDARRGYAIGRPPNWLLATHDGGVSWQPLPVPPSSRPLSAASRAECTELGCVLGRLVLPADEERLAALAQPQFAALLRAQPAGDGFVDEEEEEDEEEEDGREDDTPEHWLLRAPDAPTSCTASGAPPPRAATSEATHAVTAQLMGVRVELRTTTHGSTISWAGAHGRIEVPFDRAAYPGTLFVFAAVGDALVAQAQTGPLLLTRAGVAPLTGRGLQVSGGYLAEALPDGRLLLVAAGSRHGVPIARLVWIDPRDSTYRVRIYITAGDVGFVRSGPRAGAVVLGGTTAMGALLLVDPAAPGLPQPFSTFTSSTAPRCTAAATAATTRLTLFSPNGRLTLEETTDGEEHSVYGPQVRELEASATGACTRRITTERDCIRIGGCRTGSESVSVVAGRAWTSTWTHDGHTSPVTCHAGDEDED